MPGVRCPNCQAQGKEVWVIPGKNCHICHTPCAWWARDPVLHISHDKRDRVQSYVPMLSEHDLIPSHHNISQPCGGSWISRMNSIHPTTRKEGLRIFWRSTLHTYLALGKPQAKGAIGFYCGAPVSVSLFFSAFWSWDTTFLLSLQSIVFTNIIGCYIYHRAKSNTLSDQVEVPLTLNWASSSTFVLHIQYVHTK